MPDKTAVYLRLSKYLIGYKTLRVIVTLGLAIFAIPLRASAHCPLCTLGVGVLAVGASSLGLNYGAIGVFVGAFAVAIGLWLDRILLKRYVKYQEWYLAIISFLVTVLPLRPLFLSYGSIYIDWAGSYGSLLNRTYLLDRFLFGSIAGAVVLIIAPLVSKKITYWRQGKKIAYQSVVTTLVLLILLAIIGQYSL